jgi:hypothetical protein
MFGSSLSLSLFVCARVCFVRVRVSESEEKTSKIGKKSAHKKYAKTPMM